MKGKLAIRRLVYNWRMWRAERLLAKAGDVYDKAGEAGFALEAYDLSIRSSFRTPAIRKRGQP